jgi:hypothetical protein
MVTKSSYNWLPTPCKDSHGLLLKMTKKDTNTIIMRLCFWPYRATMQLFYCSGHTTPNNVQQCSDSFLIQIPIYNNEAELFMGPGAGGLAWAPVGCSWKKTNDLFQSSLRCKGQIIHIGHEAATLLLLHNRHKFLSLWAPGGHGPGCFAPPRPMLHHWQRWPKKSLKFWESI